jgi:phosphatidylglycerol:prolipoprotein diacylglycerol transferase
MIPFPNIDPVAISFGVFQIRWYALAYLAGILIGWGGVRRLADRYGAISKVQIDDFIAYVIAGIILGGRFGYVIFYNAPYYLSNPLEMLYIWQGGMSFHGGVLGVIAACLIYARRYKISFWHLLDMVAAFTPVGLFFGRVANFINAELYGRITESPWGIVFPNAGDLPRHPSQLYEAVLEGLVLGLVLQILVWKTAILKCRGAVGCLFLIGYGISRIIIENFREPDPQIGFLIAQITMGQLLSCIMVLVGTVGLWFFVKRSQSI